MKVGKKTFILIETILAILVIILAFFMIREKNGEEKARIAVIVQNPDDMQWSAFKYGLEKAAEDYHIAVSVISTGTMKSKGQEKQVIEQEVQKGVDALILQPVSGADVKAMTREFSIPVVLIEHVSSVETEGDSLPVVGPDQAMLGKKLAEEVIKDYQGNLRGKEIGIFSNTTDLSVITEREKGVREVLESADASIRWSVAGDFQEISNVFLGGQPNVDVVLALDDTSLTRFGEYAADMAYETQVYGIGHSTEAIYYLDKGVVDCLLVPDEFSVGYQSVAEVIRRLQGSGGDMQGHKISFKVIRQETLFSKENQEVLFTMSQ